MAEDTGAAPAAAEGVVAPVDEQIVDVPNPVETIDEPAKAEPAKVPSTREAIDKAFAKVGVDQKPDAKAEAKLDPKAKVEAKEPAKDEKPRDETGKFAAKDKPADSGKLADATAAKTGAEQAAPAKSTYEAPKRLLPDERAEWDAWPEKARAAFTRLDDNTNKGQEKYRVQVERDNGLAEFHDMATKSGTTVKEALARYVNTENKLRGDLLGGLDAIISQATNGKSSLRDVAAQIMGQNPEEVASQSDATIRELKHTVAQLQQQIGGVTQTIEQQQKQAHQEREASTVKQINDWAADKPLFELLAPHIADEMRGQETPDLDAAYKAVLHKHPQLTALSTTSPVIPTPTDASSGPAKLDLAEQIRKGSKSPTGAPTPGSDPATRKPSKSNREALDKAFARIG